MTEDQAKTKWCPFARVMTQFPDRSMVPVSGNRLTDEDGPGGIRGSNCLASACMAWRKDMRLMGKYGYCGLVGHPK